MPIEMTDVRFRSSSQGPTVLDGVSLTIPDGQMIALVGPSGSGKTTLLQIIGGILNPSGVRFVAILRPGVCGGSLRRRCCWHDRRFGKTLISRSAHRSGVQEIARLVCGRC